MLNLHKYLPDQYPKDEFVSITLENLYKVRSRESHDVALEAIFAEGVKYANEVFIIGMDEYNELKAKYEALLAKTADTVPDPDAERIAVSQMLGMGNVFKQ